MASDSPKDGASPRHEPLPLETEAQQVLEELWAEKLIPFKLNAAKITKEVGQYTIHFYDSRIRTVSVPLTGRDSFKAMLKKAVLARVKRMSGPLKDWDKN
jgi:hypothetical protein